jgi:hypothetical protein
MGLFDWFRRSKPKPPAAQSKVSEEVSLPQLCYDVAYFVLPHYAYHDLPKLADLCRNQPNAAGPFYYVMACLSRKVEPDIEAGKRFRWHHGTRDDGWEYFVLEYPVPPPIDLSGIDVEDFAAGPVLVLAPHFSAVRHHPATGEVKYFVLGQAPMGGGTTLRAVMPDGANCNLGPGPEPRLEAFLGAIRQT